MAAWSTNVHTLLGVLLAATWLNTGLFAVELTQAIFYFRTFHDSLLLRSVVASCVVIDAICTLAEYVTVYENAISFFGNMAHTLDPNPVARALYILPTALVAFIVQSFLVRRVYKLSESKILAGILYLLALFALGSGVALLVRLSTFAKINERAENRMVSIMWFSASAGVDVLIAGFLAFYLHRARKTSSFDTTRSTLGKLIMISIETGSITATCAIVDLCIFVTHSNTNVSVAWTFFLARTYTITLLYNLNVRASLKSSSRGESSDAAISLSGIRNPIRGVSQHGPISSTQTQPDNYGIKIQVEQKSVSHRDDPEAGYVRSEDEDNGSKKRRFP